MRGLSSFIVSHKKLILAVFGMLIILSFIGMRFVRIEYDLSSYLPREMNSIQGKELLEKDFKVNGTAKILIKSDDLVHMQSVKKQLEGVVGVKDILWLDDVEDVMKQEAFLDSKLTERFRQDGYNLFQVEFMEGNDDKLTNHALREISNIIQEEHYIGGPAAVSKAMQDTVANEMGLYSAAAFVIIFIILFMSSSSYFEPVLFFLVLGVAILLNMGSNFVFGKISSNTYSVASILQLAVSMDYSIFLLHRFHDELQSRGQKEAMMVAIEKTFSSVSASALTTVCGFLALVAMKYGMGKDMGLVLAKGVFISLITVITLLPVLALATENRFSKYKHKILLPGFDKSAKYMVKVRYAVLILCALILIPTFLGQSKLSYYYSTEKTLSKTSEAVIANQKIDEVFGNNNELLLIVPKTERVKLSSLTEELQKVDGIGSAVGLYTSVDEALPDFFIPQSIKDRFETERYTYIVLVLTAGVEGEAPQRSIKDVKTVASKYFSEHYLTGEASVYLDLSTVTSTDFTRINVISTLLIGLILLITFKSISLPLILILVIQLGIWINLSIPYFQGVELNFISFIIIGAIQLGATVDYAILFTSRYKENLEQLPPKEAMVHTIKDTGRSVLTSALILIAGTFSVSFITTIRSASELTLLIGRGALISLVLVYLLLPALLLPLNKVIKHTTIGWPISRNRIEGGKKVEKTV